MRRPNLIAFGSRNTSTRRQAAINCPPADQLGLENDGSCSDCLLGGAAQENPLYLGCNLRGLILAFLVGKTGKRVLSHDELVVRQAHHAGHGFRGRQEDVGDNGGSWDSQTLHLDAVVHTARAARPSIPNPDNQCVNLVQKLLDGLGFGGQRCRVLAKENHVLDVVFLFEDLPELQ